MSENRAIARGVCCDKFGMPNAAPDEWEPLPMGADPAQLAALRLQGLIETRFHYNGGQWRASKDHIYLEDNKHINIKLQSVDPGYFSMMDKMVGNTKAESGKSNATALELAKRLRTAALTAFHDDDSAPNSAERGRAFERLKAMLDAALFLDKHHGD